MIYNSLEYVEKDLEFQQKLFSIYRKELKLLPKGSLSTQTIKGKTYYTHKLKDKRKYLGRKDQATVQALQKRHFLSASIKRIQSNLDAMEKFIKHYKMIDPNVIGDSFTKAYRPLPDDCFDLSKSINFTTWENEPYDKCKKFLEQLKHMTMKGEKVRSKSEAIVANMLVSRNIPYHYEEVLKLPDITLNPDFKIAVRSENRFRLLEHCGMISKPKYRDTFLEKLETYLLNGYIPFIDVVFTFDDQEGRIDTLQISKILNAFML